MVVVVLTDCPVKLRGDLSKWLFEINTGVYVGNLSTRVRELLWKRKRTPGILFVRMVSARQLCMRRQDECRQRV